MSKLYLMMGAPGSGKSYWAREHVQEKTDRWISRDAVRFSMLEDGDDYFSKEKEVFKEYMKQINYALDLGYNVFADATHLNFNSRNKTISNITAKVDEINVIYLKTPLDICLERNSHRTGRKFVPPTSIKNMFNSIREPEANEGIEKLYIYELNQKPIVKYLEETR